MSCNVVGIGEALWDLLPGGPQMGGAPANFTCHAQALGAASAIVTRVGTDAFGDGIARFFAERGIGCSALQRDAEAPTGTVSVTLSGQGVPHFTIHDNVAWDCLEETTAALELMVQADAVCFGSLAQRHEFARVTVHRLLWATRQDSWRIFDVNLREPFYSRAVIEASLERANVLKLNDGELPLLAGMFEARGTVREQMDGLAARFDLKVVALTRGPDGSVLFREGEWSERGSVPLEIVDTVGAGDAFTAALAMGLLAGKPLGEIHALADSVARYVCSRAGATPPLPAEFRAQLAG